MPYTLFILIALGSFTSIIGLKKHNSTFQAYSFVITYIILCILFYSLLVKITIICGDLASIYIIGILGGLLLFAVFVIMINILYEFCTYTKEYPYLSLNEFENYSAITPKAWSVTKFLVYNSDIHKYFALTLWEYIILCIRKSIKDDEKSRAENAEVRKELQRYMRKELEKLQQNQQSQ